MPTEKRIRSDYPIRELQGSRVWVARKYYDCGWHWTDGLYETQGMPIKRGDTYVRISETRLPICLACSGATPDDFVTITKERKP